MESNIFDNSPMVDRLSAGQSNGPIRIAYATSLRELADEGIGTLISRLNDSLGALQSYLLDGHIPLSHDSASQHWNHLQGQTYEITLVVVDDDVISPAVLRRLAASGLALSVRPSSTWRLIPLVNIEERTLVKAQYEWMNFQSRCLAHGFDLILSDSYRPLFGPTTLEGHLFTSGFGLPSFQVMLARFNSGITPKVEVELTAGDFTELSEVGQSITRNGFTIRHLRDDAGVDHLALYTLPMEGRMLNIHPANTHDLPGYTPTADAVFRHSLFRRVNSAENFITRDGERFYRIPLRFSFLLSARNNQDLFIGLAERRITKLSASSRERIQNGENLDGFVFEAMKEGQMRRYQLRVQSGSIRVFEHEATRARGLFVERTVGIEKVQIFRRTSVEMGDDGNWYLITPVEGERGRFLSKTGATLHYVDRGIDTGSVIHPVTPPRNSNSERIGATGKSSSTPIRNSDTSTCASMHEEVPRGTFTLVNRPIDTQNIFQNPARMAELRQTSSPAEFRRLLKAAACPRDNNSYRDGEQRLRERNYATKNIILRYGLIKVLHDPRMLERISLSRMERAKVLSQNKTLQRASVQVQNAQLRAPMLAQNH